MTSRHSGVTLTRRYLTFFANLFWQIVDIYRLIGSYIRHDGTTTLAAKKNTYTWTGSLRPLHFRAGLATLSFYKTNPTSQGLMSATFAGAREWVWIWNASQRRQKCK